MEFFANEISIHRQFHDLPTFHGALERLIGMRGVARRFGLNVYCHRALVDAEPVPGLRMQQVVQRLANNERRALMSWLTRGGPFWDDLRRHDANEWLECRGEIVTDTAVGESAYRALRGVECALISATPSDWDFSPVEVIWNREAEGLDNQNAALENWRDAAALEERLQHAAPPMRSWDDLGDFSKIRFSRLTFTVLCFDPLAGVPFAKSAADRILELLSILDRFANAFDAGGSRTPEGSRIYQDYFTGGENALFSDSSDPEKRKFRTKLTFPHPNEPGGSLFCTWHGKVRHMTLRLHFSWPIRAGEPVYVVYAGPKLTKQ